MGPLLKPDVLAEFARPHSSGADLVTEEQDHFLLGFEAQARRYPFLGAGSRGAGSRGGVRLG
ncbi:MULTISPECIES: hypothetical protein [unclassified Nonomuraea]|uniref:hypothetical protein n=1 Tax=unclassified Nonomuraea TaxID=2593643 RepID=UPI0033F7EEF1